MVNVLSQWFTPSHIVLSDLLLALELNEGYHYLPRLWSGRFIFFLFYDLLSALISYHRVGSAIAASSQASWLKCIFAE